MKMDTAALMDAFTKQNEDISFEVKTPDMAFCGQDRRWCGRRRGHGGPGMGRRWMGRPDPRWMPFWETHSLPGPRQTPFGWMKRGHGGEFGGKGCPPFVPWGGPHDWRGFGYRSWAGPRSTWGPVYTPWAGYAHPRMPCGGCTCDRPRYKCNFRE